MSLEGLKPGDIVGPVRIGYGASLETWTGVLHTVTSVSAKRFKVYGDNWYDKATGRQVGRRSGNYRYILATPEMIAEYAANEQDKKAFEERQDYQDVCAILGALYEMEPRKHPLDLLTPEEWAELRKRLKA